MTFDHAANGCKDRRDITPFDPSPAPRIKYGLQLLDNKGNIAARFAAIDAWQNVHGELPLKLKFIIEGEEEIGSPSMPDLLDKYSEELAADVFVIADSVNWAVGEPSLTTTLRGLVDAVITVSTLEQGLHSGQYGGVVPDALTALSRLIATLHDEAGDVAIEGLTSHPGPELEYPADQLQEETGLLPGVQQIGTGSVTERMWYKPACSVLAIDTTRIAEASNTLIPQASAKVSLRLAPGQDPEQAFEALRRHIEANTPWGAQVEITGGQAGAPSTLNLEGPRFESAVEAFHEAFATNPVEIGCGGSIPIVSEFATRNPDATVLVTAVTDPGSRMHGIDESVDLGDLAKAAMAETLLLGNLAVGRG